MNRTRNEVRSRWLASREPSQRTGDEALKFFDECWADGLRLANRQLSQQFPNSILIWQS
ncbi:TPA: hypothetical protein ACX3AI_004856 [Klebsiella pneumoniae]|jgi:hypothetical protein|uniref:hypothetical protein n=1 Tax=Klebsiella TaxID=570 RepID=UPI000E2C9887|nr:MULTISPECIES: hypothetical protein [Klebsiella]MCE0126444.1 hypothetical protein [Klebsiella pneumoniae]MCE0167250.1 hypothetical protein [Klebsiella pneumoniae]MCE0311748.1 hypothetical protein [Klebsiella pneumoniae]MDE1625648.1 hypothetical protein [Klebsiella variicola]MDI6998449.1 hypothetical protein [Klebsiella pneumoniae]